MNNKIFNNTNSRIISIFTSNLNINTHGREIARKLKANQRTIKLALDNLEKNKILKSEIKGKNKEFRLNKDNRLTEQILAIAEIYKSYKLLSYNFEVYSIIDDLKQITSKPILIYGSFAKNYATKESDLDILIIDKKKRLDKIKNKYSREIHIMFLTEKQFIEGLKNKHNFIKELIDNHIIIQGWEDITRWRFKYGTD